MGKDGERIAGSEILVPEDGETSAMVDGCPAITKHGSRVRTEDPHPYESSIYTFYVQSKAKWVSLDFLVNAFSTVG